MLALWPFVTRGSIPSLSSSFQSSSLSVSSSPSFKARVAKHNRNPSGEAVVMRRKNAGACLHYSVRKPNRYLVFTWRFTCTWRRKSLSSFGHIAKREEEPGREPPWPCSPLLPSPRRASPSRSGRQLISSRSPSLHIR